MILSDLVIPTRCLKDGESFRLHASMTIPMMLYG